MSYEGQEVQLLNCLRDIKLIIIRFLLIRSIFDKYYNKGFDILKNLAITQSLKSRGLDRESFDDLVELFEDSSTPVNYLLKDIDTELKQIYEK